MKQPKKHTKRRVTKKQNDESFARIHKELSRLEQENERLRNVVTKEER